MFVYLTVRWHWLGEKMKIIDFRRLRCSDADLRKKTKINISNALGAFSIGENVPK